ncbi:MAG: hypothetical protein NC253_07980 [Ruminococcus sp.]|nr:hypothetical protein [Ruminococcus sp.]MCM1478169.1 hypothetical protein [Muribaculaceae bacterium]
MKKQRLKKIISGIIAAACIMTAAAGCSQNVGEETTTAQAEGTTVPAESEEDPFATTTIAAGDDYAINKLTNKTEGDEFPGGYKLVDYSEEGQGKYFVNGKSQVIIRAGNYAESFPDLATWAESTSAGIVISNITNKAADTDFGDPVESTICGFDAIYYDYEMIYYEFVENPDDPDGEKIKSEYARSVGRNYYFYSEQDVYAVMFDTAKADWEEQLKCYNEFIADLQVTKTNY